MKTTAKYRTILFIITLLVLIALAVSLLGILFHGGLSHLGYNEVNAHEGQVLINDGFDFVWITPLEDVAVNPFQESDFARRDGKVSYIGSDYTTLRGVDVSEHQLRIDWARAAEDIDFAYIRAGYRGFTEGGLFTDPYFEYNIKNASENGLLTGVYFFSQATSAAEAAEEALYVLDLIDGCKIDLPIMFDWEKMDEQENARTNDVSDATRTACAKAFCEAVEAAGYRAGVYFNRNLGYYGYDLSALKDFSFWITVPGEFPDFYYAGEFWQYSFEERVNGFSELCDMNLMFIPKESEG